MGGQHFGQVRAEVAVLDRYVSGGMKAVFTDQRRFENWRRVELAVLAGYVQVGMVTVEVLAAAHRYACPSARAVNDRERETGHDVVAFLLEWTAEMPAYVSSRLHRGLTSSDVVDTAQAIALGDASALIGGQLDRLVAILADHALAHRDTARIGRTHGQHATREVWGHRVADFALAADRARTRLLRARDAVLVAKISGTTGTYQQVPPEVEAFAAQELGLKPVDVATQVVMRDGLAEWMFALAVAATVCEAVALEVRLGQRSEVAELAEGAGRLRAGSSSMPQKQNPIVSEKICGLARLVRSYVNPVLEGVALWHERDLTHSSVERVAVADAAALTEHIIDQTVLVMQSLVVDADQMASRLEGAAAVVLSNAALVRLTDAGLPYPQAWSVVKQANERFPGASADCFAAALREVATSARPGLDLSWTQGLVSGDPVRLNDVFERVEMLKQKRAPFDQ